MANNVLKIKINIKNLLNHIKKSNFFKKLGVAIGSSIVFLAFIFCVLNFAYNEQIFPNTYIGNVNFGGLNRIQADELLKNLEDKNKDGIISFDFNDKKYQISNTELKIDWGTKNHETIDYLLSVGRSGSPGKVLQEQSAALIGKNQAFVAFNFDGNKYNEFITDISKDINIAEKDAAIEVKDDNPVIIPEVIGRDFPLDKNGNIFYQTLGSFSTTSPINFLVLEKKPKVTSAGAELALFETQELLKRTIDIKVGEKNYNLKGKDILGLIRYIPVNGPKGVLGINSDNKIEQKKVLLPYYLAADASPEKIKEFVQKIADEVNQEPKDAKFEVVGGKVSAFQNSVVGYEVDQEKAVQSISEALKNNSSEVTLEVREVQPTIGDVSANTFRDLIGEGASSWRGSPPNRIHNLSLGASKISGTVVKPGEEFSTVKTIGEIGPSTGFLQELVIKNSTRVEPEYGGGLCQVSTTLFRAVLHAGLKITSRTAHSFRVSYYEPPVGMDATIYDPAPDFKFINTYKTPILIWAVPGSNSLDFQIFGTSENRKVEISEPALYNYVSPGEPIYTETATMASGAIRQVERATSGVSASFTYKVTSKGGEVLENETFVSKYVPIPNSYLYGPGTTGIPGQEPAPQAPSSPTPTPNPKEELIKKGAQ